MTIADMLKTTWNTIARLKHPCNRKALTLRFLHIAKRCEKSTVEHRGNSSFITYTYCDGSELELIFPKKNHE